MENPPESSSTPGDADAHASVVWDLESFLDITIEDGLTVNPDDPLLLSWAGSEDAPASQDHTHAAEPSHSLPPPLDAATPSQAMGTPSASADVLDRVRKRDVRLVCPNYLEGRVPCACPEEDEMTAEDEEVAEIVNGERKRARTGGASSAAARCQVTGCEADISELKGYHRRHRVCLRCANAASVVLDGEQKRFCQQCGKFHILPDFDEGKRSCRRKLERHNKRRRRQPTNSVSSIEKEAEVQDDDRFDDKLREEMTEYACDAIKAAVHNRTMEGDIPFGTEDGHANPVGSQPNSRIDRPNSNTPVAVSDEVNLDDQPINLRSATFSALAMDNTTYSSACPTGRISFKLYDWNPAEFPRRLRQQIFQWLANMPVELEGYIRPGCTILTVFISMPELMWKKLHQDTIDCVRDLVNAPDSLLLGRGPILIYLSNMIVQVLKDGTSLLNVKKEVHAPRLHYVYPTYFEAGKSMELIACGSNLEQPKLRFLVSFAGRYLKTDCSRVKYPRTTKYCDGSEHICNSEHKVFKIKIVQTDSKFFGPAFVEVENISGISNFVPIIIGSASICSEIKRIEDASEYSCFATNIMYENAIFDPGLGMCEALKLKQTAMSALLLDIAWLLKEHNTEDKELFLNLNNFQKITSILQFLFKNELYGIMKVIIHRLDGISNLDDVTKTEFWTSDADLLQFHEYIEEVRDLLYQKNQYDVKSEVLPRILRHGVLVPQNSSTDVYNIHPVKHDNVVNNMCSTRPKLTEEHVHDPLLTKTITHSQHFSPRLDVKSSLVKTLSANITRTSLALFVMISVTICLVACLVLLHPLGAGKFVVSITRCMFGGPMR